MTALIISLIVMAIVLVIKRIVENRKTDDECSGKCFGCNKCH